MSANRSFSMYHPKKKNFLKLSSTLLLFCAGCSKFVLHIPFLSVMSLQSQIRKLRIMCLHISTECSVL